MQSQRITTSEINLWIMNDEGLYNWWKSSRLSIRNFIRENRSELISMIEKAIGR